MLNTICLTHSIWKTSSITLNGAQRHHFCFPAYVICHAGRCYHCLQNIFHLLENSSFFLLCCVFFFFFFFRKLKLTHFSWILSISRFFLKFLWSLMVCAVLNLVNLIFAIIFSYNSVIRHNTYWCQFFLWNKMSKCLVTFAPFLLSAIFCFFIQVTVSLKKVLKQSVKFVSSFKAALMKLSFPVDSMFWSSLCLLKKPPI